MSYKDYPFGYLPPEGTPEREEEDERYRLGLIAMHDKIALKDALNTGKGVCLAAKKYMDSLEVYKEYALLHGFDPNVE